MTTDRYLHACDASAAALLAGTQQFVAATDEDNVLRIYDTANPGVPIGSLDVGLFLEPDTTKIKEADIEGAAQIGDRIYWVTSHGRNKSGEEKKFRQRLFATEVVRNGTTVTLRPVGKPYKRLIADLGSAPTLTAFDLAAAAAKEQSPELPGGFNIEGLAATRDGHLLIGFRNPVPNGRALLVRLRNPAAVVDGTSTAQLELAAHLDLGGRGIRAIEHVAALGVYVIVAGAADDSRNFAIFQWSGGASDAPSRVAANLGELKPEELVALDSIGRQLSLCVLSDDGTDDCKEKPAEQKSFRGQRLTVTL